MIFLCIDLGEGKGCTNACICMGKHSQPLLQNHLIDFDYPRATHCGGDIVTLLFSACFRPSVRARTL